MLIHLLENTVDIASNVDLSKKWVKITHWCGFTPKENWLISTVDVPSYLKKSVDGWYLQSKWTWNRKHREHWPYSPILHNKMMYKMDSDAFTRTISSASHKTTHNQETNTHYKVYDGHRVAYPPGLLGATTHLRFLVWRFKCFAFGPGRLFRKSQDHWPMVPYGPISDEKWSRTHIYKKFMVP